MAISPRISSSADRQHGRTIFRRRHLLRLGCGGPAKAWAREITALSPADPYFAGDAAAAKLRMRLGQAAHDISTSTDRGPPTASTTSWLAKSGRRAAGCWGRGDRRGITASLSPLNRLLTAGGARPAGHSRQCVMVSRGGVRATRPPISEIVLSVVVQWHGIGGIGLT